jgi:hypothetical protein
MTVTLYVLGCLKQGVKCRGVKPNGYYECCASTPARIPSLMLFAPQYCNTRAIISPQIVICYRRNAKVGLWPLQAVFLIPVQVPSSRYIVIFPNRARQTWSTVRPMHAPPYSRLQVPPGWYKYWLVGYSTVCCTVRSSCRIIVWRQHLLFRVESVDDVSLLEVLFLEFGDGRKQSKARWAIALYR